MILVDTSVWVVHLSRGDERMGGLLESGQVMMHPFGAGELAMGRLEPRAAILNRLNRLPQAVVASHREVLRLIEGSGLVSSGIGFVDAHLLAAVRLTPDASLWTRDKRLHAAAQRLALATPNP